MSRFRTNPAERYVSRQGGVALGEPSVRGAAMNLVVSDALARFWIVERLPGLSSLAELHRYAALQFQQIFGDDPAAWAIRIDAAPFVKRWLACALPAGLVVDLQRQAKEYDWQIASLQPHFIREYNAHCRHLKGDVAFSVASAETTTIGVAVRGQWCGVRIHPSLERSQAGFKVLLQRDCLQYGVRVGALQPYLVGPLSEVA